ncbi:HIT domain-containing protein [Taklimakanibacter deserti]|uniref:HIT domain-containing protein n=1 Tax=Taklimakanibacter deserti TaxID=2267839 RepID=UPI000E64763D
MTEGFLLAQRLEADSLFLVDWPLCQVRLMDDARFPWLILVPRRPGLEEWTELEPEDSALLAQEIGRAAEALARMFTPTKLNVGALGNIVRQMHVHVIARFATDAAWPGPVWGQGLRIPYEALPRDRLCAGLLPLLK